MRIIPRESLKSFKSLNILFYFNLIFFFLLILIFIIADSFTEKYEKEYLYLVQAIEERAPPKEIKLKESEILIYQEKLKTFNFLFDKRMPASKFFIAIEEVTHPDIWFSRVDLDFERKNAIFSGHTKSIRSLGQQFYILKKQNWIKDINIETISINKLAGFDFSFNLVFNIKLFNENK